MISPSPLTLYDRIFLRLFYMKRLWIHNLPENQVGWRSRENQELRFTDLTGIGDLKGKKILDLGCGLGCFCFTCFFFCWHLVLLLDVKRS